MRKSHAIQGATLIAVILLTLLILSIIMAATLRLSLSGRQSSGDQRATLQAQYKAESNVNLVRSRLRDIQGVLSAVSPADGSTPFLSYTGSYSDMETLAKQFCGQSSTTNPWTKQPENAMATGGSGTTYECDAQPSNFANDKFTILGTLVTPNAYSYLPSTDNPPAGTASVATKTAWWQSYLNNATLGDSQYTVVPVKVLKLSRSYRFYVKLDNISTKSTSNGSTRLINAYGSKDGIWWFQINYNNIFDNAWVIDKWDPSSDGGFGAAKTIGGNFFTNQKVTLLSANKTITFLGDLKSAGCTSYNTPTATNPVPDCNRSQGYGYLKNGGGTLVTSTASNYNQVVKNTFTANKISVGGDANFGETYTPLPLQSTSQKSDAATNGITLGSNVTGITLYAGTANGNYLTTYNATTSSWNEPSGTYQYIKVTNPKGSIWYRYGSDNQLYSSTNGTSFSATGSNFNGVIYSDHKVSIDGPARIGNDRTGDVSKIPPALASFSKLNLTIDGGITLNTDLTMSNTPCSFDNTLLGGTTQQGCPKADGTVTNALALYSTSGDITMSTSTPNNATYHAAILASNGTFNVQNAAGRPAQGVRHVVGAVVEQHYGLNGIYNSSAGGITAGYDDNFYQDKRFEDPELIPSNPILSSNSSWSFSNANTDNTQPNYTDLSSILWKQSGQ